MIEYVSEYRLWVLAGILFLFVLSLLSSKSFRGNSVQFVLSLLSSKFFSRNPVQHSRESEPHQGDVEANSEARFDHHSQRLEDTVDDLKQYSSDLNLSLHALTVEIRGVRVSLNQIAELLQSQVKPQTPDISSPVEESEKASTPYQDLAESPELSENEPSEQLSADGSQETEKPVPFLQSEPSEWMSPVLAEFCDLYNAHEQGELQARYQSHYRISVVNAIQRRQRQSEPPLFENRTNGKFFAYYIEEENLYAVVPSYGLVLERSVYGPGAFGEVFNCPGFEPQHSYHVKVIRPAVFKPDSANQSWMPEEKGQLELELIS